MQKAAAIDSYRFEESQNRMFKSGSIGATVFLSHSHHDEDLIESARKILSEYGADIYIDWKDPTMPEITSPETAQLIKDKIRNCHKFIMLASNNALDSRWVPWELGYADMSKGMENIAVFPVAGVYGGWNGSEYIAIYPKIEITVQADLAVYEYGSNTGPLLSRWLSR